MCAVLAVIGCAVEREDRVRDDVRSTAPVHTEAELVEAAENVLSFLRGEAAFDQIRLADTVVLHVSPIGGGTRTPLPREQLSKPANWRAPGFGRAVYRLTPPPQATELTTLAGRHLNCFEYDLSSRVEEVAHLPHVGTKHAPPGADSCLQTWNLTLVFDADARPPVLVAAVYDQWEW